MAAEQQRRLRPPHARVIGTTSCLQDAQPRTQNCFGGRTRRLTGEISESCRARLTLPAPNMGMGAGRVFFQICSATRDRSSCVSAGHTVALDEPRERRVSAKPSASHLRCVMQGVSFEVTRSFLRERARARSCRKRQQRQSFEEKRGLRREDVQVEEVLKLLQLQEVMSCVKSTSSRRR